MSAAADDARDARHASSAAPAPTAAPTPASDDSHATVLQAMKAVAWGFFGVRKRSGYDQDMRRLKPVHVIVSGLLAAAVFIGVLVVAVQWVVSSGVAR